MAKSIQSPKSMRDTAADRRSTAGVLDASFPVRYESRRGVSDPGRQYETVAIDVALDGLKTTAPAADLADVRFVWLEFTLPDDEQRIRALGELAEHDGDAQHVRFKHLFPDHRARLERFVRRQDDLTEAA